MENNNNYQRKEADHRRFGYENRPYHEHNYSDENNFRSKREYRSSHERNRKETDEENSELFSKKTHRRGGGIRGAKAHEAGASGISKLVSYAAVASVVVSTAAVTALNSPQIKKVFSELSLNEYQINLEMDYYENPNLLISFGNDYHKKETAITSFESSDSFYTFLDNVRTETDLETVNFYCFYTGLEANNLYTFKVIDKGNLGGTTIYEEQVQTGNYHVSNLEITDKDLSFTFELANSNFKTLSLDLIDQTGNIFSTFQVESNEEQSHSQENSSLEVCPLASENRLLLNLYYNNLQEDSVYKFQVKRNKRKFYQETFHTEKQLKVEFHYKDNDPDLYYQISMSDYRKRFHAYKVKLVSLVDEQDYELPLVGDIFSEQKIKLADYDESQYRFVLIGLSYVHGFGQTYEREISLYEELLTFDQGRLVYLEINDQDLQLSFELPYDTFATLSLDLSGENLNEHFDIENLNLTEYSTQNSWVLLHVNTQENKILIQFSCENLTPDSLYHFKLAKQNRVILERDIKTEKTTSINLYHKSGDNNYFYYQFDLSDYQERYAGYKVKLTETTGNQTEHYLDVNGSITDEQKIDLAIYNAWQYEISLHATLRDSGDEFELLRETVNIDKVIAQDFTYNDFSLSTTLDLSRENFAPLVFSLLKGSEEKTIALNNLNQPQVSNSFASISLNPPSENNLLSVNVSFFGLTADTNYTFRLKRGNELLYQKNFRSEKETSVEFYRKASDNDNFYYQIDSSDYQQRFIDYRVQISEVTTGTPYIENFTLTSSNVNTEQALSLITFSAPQYNFKLFGRLRDNPQDELLLLEQALFMPIRAKMLSITSSDAYLIIDVPPYQDFEPMVARLTGEGLESVFNIDSPEDNTLFDEDNHLSISPNIQDDLVTLEFQYYLQANSEYNFVLQRGSTILYELSFRTEKDTTATFYRKTGDNENFYYQISTSDYNNSYQGYTATLTSIVNEAGATPQTYPLSIEGSISDEQVIQLDSFPAWQYVYKLYGISREDSFEIPLYEETIYIDSYRLDNLNVGDNSASFTINLSYYDFVPLKSILTISAAEIVMIIDSSESNTIVNGDCNVTVVPNVDSNLLQLSFYYPLPPDTPLSFQLKKAENDEVLISFDSHTEKVTNVSFSTKKDDSNVYYQIEHSDYQDQYKSYAVRLTGEHSPSSEPLIQLGENWSGEKVLNPNDYSPDSYIFELIGIKHDNSQAILYEDSISLFSYQQSEISMSDQEIHFTIETEASNFSPITLLLIPAGETTPLSELTIEAVTSDPNEISDDYANIAYMLDGSGELVQIIVNYNILNEDSLYRFEIQKDGRLVYYNEHHTEKITIVSIYEKPQDPNKYYKVDSHSDYQEQYVSYKVLLVDSRDPENPIVQNIVGNILTDEQVLSAPPTPAPYIYQFRFIGIKNDDSETVLFEESIEL